MSIPDNLSALHRGEKELRAESLRRIAELPDLAAHLHLIERTMDLVYALLLSTEVTEEDELHLSGASMRWRRR